MTMVGDMLLNGRLPAAMACLKALRWNSVVMLSLT